MTRTIEVIARQLLEGIVREDLLTLYVRLLAADGCQHDEAAEILDGQQNIQRLIAAEMATYGPPGPDNSHRLTPNPVDVVLQQALSALARDVLADHERLFEGHRRMNRDLVSATSATGSSNDQLARIITNPDEIAELTRILKHSAAREWLTVSHDVSHGPDIDLPDEATGHAIASEATHRAIYQSNNVEDRAARVQVEAIAQAGGEVRFLPRTAMRMKIADEVVALIPVMLSVSASALLIRSSVIVGALREYFELLWERAIPFAVPGRNTGDLTQEQLRILQLLVQDLSDEAVSDQVGTSLSTVRRRVSEIRASLGAENRFQVGVEAVRRGLVG
ncbi:hypothetical protein ABT299_02550 [Spirillospora sp. NPDC000708]|uniref:HTH luxR-type domain-containing protein n=1 Tax=Actinomadura physcomitrii TaxID=2650748 RepID=A0A6I4MEU5_9ACTN|nr:hypothetical protein [Actinomadura physcomitrii]MWA02353.1 hypothetical protein [Actinomadura physcomitrii]MWA03075.1 hypothetical protein [Actinomadura physcomitrii]